MEKKNERSWKQICDHMSLLLEHVKKFSKGAFPLVFLSLHTAIKPKDIIEMRLGDIYEIKHNKIYVRPSFQDHKTKVTYVFSDELRMEFAWYIIHRLSVIHAKEEDLDQDLCVNRNGDPLQLQTYQKMLYSFSKELNFERVYNAYYLHSLYAYSEIVSGRQTFDQLAKKYGVRTDYFMRYILKDFDCSIIEELLKEVAGCYSNTDPL